MKDDEIFKILKEGIDIHYTGESAQHVVPAVGVLAKYGADKTMRLLRAVRSAVEDIDKKHPGEDLYEAFQAMGTIVIGTAIAFNERINGDEEDNAGHDGR